MTQLIKTRKRIPDTHQLLLDELEKVLSSLDDNTQDIYPFRPHPDSPGSYNQYMDFAVSVYADKFKQLYSALASALENEWYLVYAQCARSILENAAVCRYYSFKESLVEMKRCFESGRATEELLRNAMDDLDRFVRGTRFSWDAFIEHRFDELSKTPHQPNLQQVNVQTCLSHWYKDKPRLEHLYNLLSDMVHPNLGSNLLTMRTLDNETVAGGLSGEFLCMFIVAPTLAGVVGAYMEIQQSLQRLCQLRLQPQK